MTSRIVLTTLAAAASLVVGTLAAGNTGAHARTTPASALSAPARAAAAGAGQPSVRPDEPPAASEQAAKTKPLFTITATRIEAAGGTTGLITCRGAFRDGRAYDRPYASKSSDWKRINAHLAIFCEGGRAAETKVKVTSRMKDGRRVGDADSDSGFRTARTGGDLGCVRASRSYWAKGDVLITFPAGYDPPSATASPVSVKRAFRRVGGVCVRP